MTKKRAFALAMTVALLAILMVPTTAFAGRYYSYHGKGVYNKTSYGASVRSSRTHRLDHKVAKKNGFPARVVDGARKNALNKGMIYRATLPKGTWLGHVAYSSALTSKGIRASKRTPVWYTPYEDKYIITKSGHRYERTKTYWKCVDNSCGNRGFYILRSVKDVRLYEIRLVKKLDTGELKRWKFVNRSGSKKLPTLFTSPTGSVRVGYFKKNTVITNDESQDSSFTAYTAISPSTSGKYSFKVTKDRTITFVNRLNVCPPPPVECPVYTISVVKRLDSLTGTLVAGFTIEGTIANQMGVSEARSALTRADGPTVIATLPAGWTYDFPEIQQAGYEIVSPVGGRFADTMPDHNIILTYVNRRVTPPVHQLLIAATYRVFECSSTVSAYAVLGADTVLHTDSDQIKYYVWHYNGQEYITSVDYLIVNPPYEQTIIADVTATDAAGHSSNTAIFVPRNPGSPPGTPPN